MITVNKTFLSLLISIVFLFHLPSRLMSQNALVSYLGNSTQRLLSTDDCFDTKIIYLSSDKRHTFVQLNTPKIYGNMSGGFLLLFPEDTVNINYLNNHFEFKSKNKHRQDEYNCIKELVDKYGGFYSMGFRDKDNLPHALSTEQFNEKDKLFYSQNKRHLTRPPVSNIQRDSIIYSIYQNRVRILDDYKVKNLISSDFYNIMQKWLLYRYIFLSLDGFTRDKEKKLPDRIEHLITENLYVDDSSFMLLTSYRAFLINYNEYLFSLTSYNSNDQMQQLRSIDSMPFTTMQRDFIKLVNVYQSLSSKNKNDAAIKYFFLTCTSERYKKKIENEITSYEEDVDLTKSTGGSIIDVQNKKSNISDLFNKFSKRLVYIDFWASWCMPCRAEMPYSDKLKKQYADKNISFVYISTDESKRAWLNANTEEKLGNENSYLFPNFQNSSFAKQYKIKTIPRYMLIGKDGKIINSDAPRPSDPKLKELIDKYLK